MAAKIIEIKKKNADGTFTTLIPQTASSAEYAIYASLDTSKGTIEERLKAMETTYESSVSISQGFSATINELKRHGDYVIGRLQLSTTAATNILFKNIVGVIPAGFRPNNTEIVGMSVTFRSTLFVSAGVYDSVSYENIFSTSCSINTNGEIVTAGGLTTNIVKEGSYTGGHSANTHLQTSVTINFGYEAEPRSTN